eukprot:5662531-Prymnesium_polylepis.1
MSHVIRLRFFAPLQLRLLPALPPLQPTTDAAVRQQHGCGRGACGAGLGLDEHRQGHAEAGDERAAAADARAQGAPVVHHESHMETRDPR